MCIIVSQIMYFVHYLLNVYINCVCRERGRNRGNRGKKRGRNQGNQGQGRREDPGFIFEDDNEEDYPETLDYDDCKKLQEISIEIFSL